MNNVKVNRWIAPIAILLLSQFATAQTVLSDGHVDVGIAYEDDAWDLHVHDETNDIEYGPDEALLYAGANSRSSRPAGSEWDFLGVAHGDPVWVMPMTEEPGIIFLGLGAEEIPDGTFDTYFQSDPRINASGEWIRLDVLGVSGPGFFSVWTTDGGGNPTAFVSTFSNPLSNTLFAQSGSHSHYNWGFTAVGLYDVRVRASAYKDGVLLESDEGTYHFGVEAVPEPSSAAALIVGAAALIRKRFRNKRSN